MEILKKALPLVQAMVLMGLIMFLPFLLILSQYGIKEVLTMSTLLLSIKFWPVIWAIGDWMQASLEAAILPSMAGLNGMLTLGIAEGMSINDDVIDYVINAVRSIVDDVGAVPVRYVLGHRFQNSDCNLIGCVGEAHRNKAVGGVDQGHVVNHALGRRPHSGEHSICCFTDGRR